MILNNMNRLMEEFVQDFACFLSERLIVNVSTIGSRRNSFFTDSRTCRAAIALYRRYLKI
ncbi:hypothetical protein DERP_008304 [Dermatophagoides pteronyssinus]|uniref:Uncharacterized protein n=1 Tax=Dermatophagoides pteronyssinus TaxID=6956 RepID=A0ABQ8J669_DERPT|nr:hypothetical protein DERP_008304 [Dermatophagoides pteronyssinus]